MTDSRRHHYISQGYLRGFAGKKGKKHKLWALDFKDKIQFSPSPANIAAKRDYNRVEIEGVDPNVFEKSFAQFEDDAIKEIRKLEKTLQFSGETKNYIINFIAFFYSRTPRLRERFRSFHEDLNQMLLETTLATPERWNSVGEQFKKDRPEDYIDIPYEEILEFVQKKRYTFSLRTEYHIGVELRSIENLVAILAPRNWMLVKATKESGPFITSDDPVFIDYRNPDEVPPFIRNSPGFGAIDTVVQFPVTQNLLLLGEFNGPSGVAGASRATAAQANSATIGKATRQIYAPSGDFLYIDKDLVVRDGRCLLNYIKSDRQ